MSREECVIFSDRKWQDQEKKIFACNNFVTTAVYAEPVIRKQNFDSGKGAEIMNIYITYERTFFTEQQINELGRYGKLIFLEKSFDNGKILDLLLG